MQYRSQLTRIHAAISERIATLRSRILEFSNDFYTGGRVHIPAFLTSQDAIELYHLLAFDNRAPTEIASKRGGRWMIAMLDDTLRPFQPDSGDDPFSSLMLSAEVTDFLCSISGIPSASLLTTKQWLNRYSTGQFINAHKDTTGDYQAVLCLVAPPPENGGALVLDGIGSVHLNSGDLLLFRAAEILHWTLPLHPTEALTDPVRITGIFRVYVKGGREPGSVKPDYE